MNNNEKESPIKEVNKYLDLEGLKYYDEKIKELIESQILEWGKLGGDSNG